MGAHFIPDKKSQIFIARGKVHHHFPGGGGCIWSSNQNLLAPGGGVTEWEEAFWGTLNNAQEHAKMAQNGRNHMKL